MSWMRGRVDAVYRRWWQYAFFVAPLFLLGAILAFVAGEPALCVIAVVAGTVTEWWAWASLRPQSQRR